VVGLGAVRPCWPLLGDGARHRAALRGRPCRAARDGVRHHQEDLGDGTSTAATARSTTWRKTEEEAAQMTKRFLSYHRPTSTSRPPFCRPTRATRRTVARG
jgi:hypothetical protein